MKKIILPLFIVTIFFGCVDKYSDAKEYIQAIDKCKLVIDDVIDDGYLKDFVDTLIQDDWKLIDRFIEHI